MALTASGGQKSSQNSKKDKAAKKEQRKQRPITPPGQPLKNIQVGKEVKMEQAATVKNTASDINGQFNKIFLGGIPLCQSWVKRSKNDDDLYTKLVRQLDLKSLNLEDTQSKKNWATIQQLRNFAENAFDVELQRQVIIKNAIEDAKSVHDRVPAFESEKAKELEEEEEVSDEEKNFPCLEILWEEGRQEARQNIVDKEDRFLDAKIRLMTTIPTAG
uniref:NAM-associated domain-containing protein n=1 Tax=Heterorhabditis bacteriophora TaxID=37862 RepID=A0A1I7WD26_HETBA